MSKIHLILLSLFVLLLIVGYLNRKSPEEKIYLILKEVETAENQFARQQKPLQQLEEKENELFREIMALDTNNRKKIKNLSEQALQVIKNSTNHLEQEQESIQSSQKEFSKAEKYIDKIDNKKERKTAQQLQNIMAERYENYQMLYNQYHKSLRYNEEMYMLLQKSDVSIDQLENHIVKMNKTYEEIYTYSEQFNNNTADYLTLKADFYKATNMLQ